MCAANAAVVTDDAGNRKFTKKKSTGRIDALVALAMAVGVIPPAEEPAFTGMLRIIEIE
jgi:phage terminase large subunit-like protein